MTVVVERFQISPLIRVTLVSVYLALVFPLPLLAPPGLGRWLWVAAPVGLLLVVAMLSEEVCLDSDGIRVGHPGWCRWLLRRGWQLSWEEIRSLVPVGTSQGGTVFYLTTTGKEQRLLPQRLSNFEHFLQQLHGHTGLDISKVGRLTPPWTYQLLAGLALTMLIAEIGVATALAQGWIVMPAGVPN